MEKTLHGGKVGQDGITRLNLEIIKKRPDFSGRFFIIKIKYLVNILVTIS